MARQPKDSDDGASDLEPDLADGRTPSWTGVALADEARLRTCAIVLILGSWTAIYGFLKPAGVLEPPPELSPMVLTVVAYLFGSGAAKNWKDR